MTDIAKAVDFNVQYDVNTNAVYIDTEKEYTEKISNDKADESQAIIEIPKEQEQTKFDKNGLDKCSNPFFIVLNN